jgi:predicted O-methyltransferase YrrM
MSQGTTGRKPLAGIPVGAQRLLEQLHSRSLAQEQQPTLYDAQAAIERGFEPGSVRSKSDFDEFLSDKLLALDEEKCIFVHGLVLATGATTVVEIGTGFGVSTTYLAAAVNTNLARLQRTDGVVIATEMEKQKAMVAQDNWHSMGSNFASCIRLLEGDLFDNISEEDFLPDRLIDMVYIDGEFTFDRSKPQRLIASLLVIPSVAIQALKMLSPKLRQGAVVLTNCISWKIWQDLEALEMLRGPNSKFQSTTLPYNNGLEMSIYLG